MQRVIVIGGAGHYGQRVVELLRRVRDAALEIVVAGRQGPLRLDLRDPATFAEMDGAALILNCADTVRAPPDAAARYCLERGLTFLDMGADARAVERLLALDIPKETSSEETSSEASSSEETAAGAALSDKTDAPSTSTGSTSTGSTSTGDTSTGSTSTGDTSSRARAPAPPRGLLIVGVGVFPGLSTALAAHASELAGAPETVELAIRISPFSGAGPANCALMTDMLVTPSLWFEGGERREGPPVGATRRQPFAGSGTRPASLIGLPDAALVRHVTKAPNVRTYLGLNPAFMRFNFRLLAAVLALAAAVPPIHRALLWLTGASLYLMRGLLLRNVDSRVQMTAIATPAGADATPQICTLDLPDGRDATALGVCAAALCALERDATRRPLSPGVYALPELFTLSELLDQAARVHGAPLTFERRATG